MALKKKNHLVTYVDDSLLAALRERAVASDLSVGEICRRLLRVGLYGDASRIEKRITGSIVATGKG